MVKHTTTLDLSDLPKTSLDWLLYTLGRFTTTTTIPYEFRELRRIEITYRGEVYLIDQHDTAIIWVKDKGFQVIHTTPSGYTGTLDQLRDRCSDLWPQADIDYLNTVEDTPLPFSTPEERSQQNANL